MKTIIHIFTIYVLALSLIPCSDGGNGIVEILNHSLGLEHEHIVDHTQHSNSCGDDQCAPFCICTCCTSAVDFPSKNQFSVKLFSPTPEEKPSFYQNVIISAFTSTVWQPPKS